MRREAVDARRVGVVRYVLGGLGLLLMAIGGRQLSVLPQSEDVAVWLVGALVLHDGLIAPLVLAGGFLIAAVPARGVLRGALIVGGSLVLITLPLLVRPGSPPNPSALPLPYGRNLLLVLAVVAIAAVVVAVAARYRPRHPGRRPGPGSRPQLKTTGNDGGPVPGRAAGPTPGPGSQPPGDGA